MSKTGYIYLVILIVTMVNGTVLLADSLETTENNEKNKIYTNNLENKKPLQSEIEEKSTLLSYLLKGNFSSDSEEQIIEVLKTKVNVLEGDSFDPLWSKINTKNNFGAYVILDNVSLDSLLLVSYNDVDKLGIVNEFIFSIYDYKGDLIKTDTIQDSLFGENYYGESLSCECNTSYPGNEVIVSMIENQNADDGEFEDTLITRLFIYETTNWTIIDTIFLQNAHYIQFNSNLNNYTNSLVTIEKILDTESSRYSFLNVSSIFDSIWNSGWINTTQLTINQFSNKNPISNEFLLWFYEKNSSIDSFQFLDYNRAQNSFQLAQKELGLNNTGLGKIHLSEIEGSDFYLAGGKQGLEWRDKSHNTKIRINESLVVLETLNYNNDLVPDIFIEIKGENESTKSLMIIDGVTLETLVNYTLDLLESIDERVLIGKFDNNTINQRPVFIIGTEYYLVNSNGKISPGLLLFTFPSQGDRLPFCTLLTLHFEWTYFSEFEILKLTITTPWQEFKINPNLRSLSIPVSNELISFPKVIQFSLIAELSSSRIIESRLSVEIVPNFCQGSNWPTDSIQIFPYNDVPKIPGLALFISIVILVIPLSLITINILQGITNKLKPEK